jgi:hypothetical protein
MAVSEDMACRLTGYSRGPFQVEALISVAMASFSAENDLNSFPLREISLLSPCSIRTSDRKPSHLISKNQSGRLNGRGLRPSGIVWKCGRGTEISIANPVLAAQAPAVASRDSMN